MTSLHSAGSVLALAFVLAAGTAATAQAPTSDKEAGTNQTTGAPSSPGTALPNSATTPPTTLATNGDTMSLTDIVVTAEKQERSLQKTTLSVAALDGETLAREGKGNLQEALRDVAGVQLNGTGGAGQGFFVTIRGVGFAPAFGQDSPVTVSLNGVFQQRAQSTRALFYDIARVEVVRGPDSTLNGRNAEGGSVTIISNEPVHKFDASATAEAGNYGLYSGQGMVNIPIGDTLALRGAFSAEHRNGYLSNGANDSKVYGVRGRALWEPAPAVKVILSADYSKQMGIGQQQSVSGLIDLSKQLSFPLGYWYTFNPTNSFRTFKNGNYYADVTADLGFATLYMQPSYNRSRYVNVTNTYSLLTYLTRLAQAQRSGNPNATTVATDLSAANGQEISRQDQKSLEVRLSSPAHSKLTWMTGFYYLDNKEDTNVNMATGTSTPAATNSATDPLGGAVTAGAVGNYPVAPPAFYSSVSPHREVRDYAGYGQLTVPLTDHFRITAGGRYTRERKLRNEQIGNLCVANTIQTSTCATSGSAANNGTPINTTLFYLLDNGIAGTTTNSSGINSAANPLGNQVFFTVPAGRAVFTRKDFKFSAQYDIAAHSNVYALVSTGFKSGGFVNLPPADSGLLNPGFSNTYNPESLTSYEIGSKNELFDRRVRVNVSAFYYDYKNYQFSYSAQVFNPNATVPGTARKIDPDFYSTITANAAKARSYGGEFESTFIISPTDQFTLDISYLHARFKTLNLSGGNATTQALGLALAGTPLPRSPTLTILPGYSHIFPISGAGDIIASVDGHFETKSVITVPSNAAQIAAGYFIQPDFFKTNASLAFNSEDGKWGITAYIRNITNKGTLQSLALPTSYTGQITVAGVADAGNVSFESADPRTYGITFSAKW